ncbi:Cys-tRNA(Pro) deacylase [Sphingomonas jatrophae]|uniref:Cys-tRNA(Pro)/Cys-tRNA(Cys) deacylase n=1 Tax=Sphingomonas jatrophae TaxID=1166337 RepID=A0A1I6LS20_9SPHN|nr:Cys-tRNA(Pro) deacylase [Sphingomonas jatrophae]SFS06090.1 Cys-tRNA(Pro)/Cys-tRNA(Cys) deacylase [Sphingomonas jatrophae]
MAATRAIAALEAAGVGYTLHRYDYDPAADSVGLAAAAALGIEPARMLKTLMLLADGKPACAVLPSDASLSMKRAAALLGAKAAKMMPPADAERMTGYKVGGISPFGQLKRVPVLVEAAALGHARVFVNGGQRGLQLEIAPAVLVDLLGAKAGEIVA